MSTARAPAGAAGFHLEVSADMRTWVSPRGEYHEVSDEGLAAFCRVNGNMHHGNMLAHISLASSDQKNDGWRLIERLRCIRLRDRPSVLVPALGSLESFHAECLSATDGRKKMKDKGTLGKLLAGTYRGGGKGWHGWELCQLSTEEKRAVLRKRLAAQATPECEQRLASSAPAPPPSSSTCDVITVGAQSHAGAPFALVDGRLVRCLPRLDFLGPRPENARSPSCPTSIPFLQRERSRFREALGNSSDWAENGELRIRLEYQGQYWS